MQRMSDFVQTFSFATIQICAIFSKNRVGLKEESNFVPRIHEIVIFSLQNKFMM